MPEEGLAETPAVETPAETTPAPDWVSVDGTLAEGWASHLDEGYKEEKMLSTVKDVKSLAKIAVDAKKMIGKNKVAVPTENSTEAEWNEFYTAGGMPATAEDYHLEYPQDMPTPEVPELRQAYMEHSHKIGKSQAQAQADYEFYNNLIKKAHEAQEQAEKDAMLDATEKLKLEWGNAFEQKQHFGNVAIEEGVKGDLELKDRIVDKYGNDPDFIKVMANLGDKFAEHRTISPNIPTPGDIQTQIDTLMSNPLYTHGTKAERLRIANQIMRLRESQNKG